MFGNINYHICTTLPRNKKKETFIFFRSDFQRQKRKKKYLKTSRENLILHLQRFLQRGANTAIEKLKYHRHFS